jgi:transcription elongation factor GreA
MTDEGRYLTEEGAADLRRELEELKSVKRPELAAKLKEAISQGDLSENADYQDAKEQQAFMEGRISYLEEILRTSKIVAEHTGKTKQINIGSTVTVQEKGTTLLEKYTLVGGAEANPREGKISNESPLGNALMGRKKNDKVKVTTPSGEITFVIKEIE